MKNILYLYRTDRRGVWEDVQVGQVQATPLYGLNHLPEFGLDSEFYDEDRQLRIVPRLFQMLGRSVIRCTELGWNPGQALQTLSRIRKFDGVFATTDSTGLPLAALKRLGAWNGHLIMASQGLTDSLEMKGWNWAFRLHRWSLEAVDRFVTYGWAERQELVNLFGVPEHKVKWIPFGVDTDYFLRFPSTETAVPEDVVLSVGRDRCRDYGLLLEAAKQLPEISFRIIASPGNLVRLKPPHNVQVLYDLPIKEVTRHFLTCRFVVLPVRESSYSFATTTAFEAMALGKAVLVSRTRAVGPEQGGYDLENGKHCRFMPVGNVAEAVRYIRELWNAPAECQIMGFQARAQVQRAFNTRILASRLADVFREVIP